MTLLDRNRAVSLVLMFIGLQVMGCVSSTFLSGRVIFSEGLDEVRIDPDETPVPHTHPVTLLPSEVGTLLHAVRAGERRNPIHRLAMGDAPKTRVFRDDEIAILAGPISKALAQARPSERVYFHLSQADPTGGEVTTTGWIFVREPILYLLLGEAHDLHAPRPDISKYIREMPDVAESPTEFSATFEPEDFLEKAVSKGSWLAPDQLEELQIRFRDALKALPPFEIAGPATKEPASRPAP